MSISFPRELLYQIDRIASEESRSRVNWMRPGRRWDFMRLAALTASPHASY
jgi:hypothetical protein